MSQIDKKASQIDRKVLPTGKFVWLRVESVSLIDKLYPSSHLQSCSWCIRHFFCTLRDTFNLSATLFSPSATLFSPSATLFSPSATLFGLSATIFYLSATLSNHLQHFQPISIHFPHHLSYIYCTKIRTYTTSHDVSHPNKIFYFNRRDDTM